MPLPVDEYKNLQNRQNMQKQLKHIQAVRAKALAKEEKENNNRKKKEKKKPQKQVYVIQPSRAKAYVLLGLQIPPPRKPGPPASRFSWNDKSKKKSTGCTFM
jgi:hypothetical protein